MPISLTETSSTPVLRPMAAGADWQVSEFVCSAGPDARPFEERHAQVSIAAVLEGSFTYWGDTGRAVLYPGSLLLGNAGACYQCGHDHSRGDRCISFSFSQAYFSEVAASAAGSSRFVFPAAMLPALPATLPWLARIEAGLCGADRLAADELAPRFMEWVIGTLCGAAPTRVRHSGRDERRMREALRYIELNAGEELNLERLAGVAGMSKYHFLRVFRSIAGMTPYQFLLSVRMRRAARELATTVRPVSGIAYEAGFGDLSTFNGRFRDIFGINPRAYRAEISRRPASADC